MSKCTSGGYSNQRLELEPDYVPPVVEVQPIPSSVQHAQAGTLADIRKWAKENGFQVSDIGRIKQDVLDAYWAVIGRGKLASKE